MRRVGFEGKLYWGVAGSTGATELKIAIDVSYKFEPTKADVGDRESIIDYDKVAGIKFSLEFNTNNDDSNAFVAAARAAAAAGTLIAFRTRDKAAGWGCDGDFSISLDESQPNRDKQQLKITATPCNDNRALTWS
jgi:hypothetical protein